MKSTIFTPPCSPCPAKQALLSTLFLPPVLHTSFNGHSYKACKSAKQHISAGLQDFIGGDLLGFDLGNWSKDLEKYGALAIYPPHEGGYEGRYATRLKGEGYHFLDLTARGLGDLESCLTKVHGVRPPHLGKQAISVWYFPPEIDYRLSLLPKDSKGLILWLIEAQVLSKAELQYLALLPALRPNVKVIAECGNWRKFVWKPLKEVCGLPMGESTTVAESASPIKQIQEEVAEKKSVLATNS